MKYVITYFPKIGSKRVMVVSSKELKTTTEWLEKDGARIIKTEKLK